MRSVSLLITPVLLPVVIAGGLSFAPPAAADCVSSAGTTICGQGDVRGADTGDAPSGAYPMDPYCGYNGYCDDDWGWDVDIDVPVPPRPGGPIFPGRPGGGGGIGPRR
jgi:hypothetical protein